MEANAIMRFGDAAPRLLGRTTECEALDRLVSEVVGGASRVVVLRGEAGVGKTALLEYVANGVADWRLVRAVGVESEMEFAYNGLHQLCVPLLADLELLPAPQRQALAIVLGQSLGPAPDRFLVALATLTLFAEAADRKPLACLVDDAQWLDGASADVISFVGRRLHAEQVALVCTARTGVGDDVLTGLPTFPVEGLDPSAARALLLDNLRAPIEAAICDQIVSESHGNPLAILELPLTWNASLAASGLGPSQPRPVTDKIERSFLERLLGLPADTQLLVLVAAADPVGDPVRLNSAAATLGIDLSAADPAVDAGLLSIRGRVEFAHPLIRSATYRAATAENRRRVHAALAEATDADAEPDRRAWHRSEATAGLDEQVAADLEQSAGRAQARAGLAAAARFLTRATELTPDPTRRVGRALTAAMANVQAGAFDTADQLINAASAGPADELQLAHIDLLRAQLAFMSSRGADATALMLAAAERLRTLDSNLARETYLDAFSAALFAARLSGAIGVREIAQAARAAPQPSAEAATAADLLLDALVELTGDYARAVPSCQRALQRLTGEAASPQEKLRWLWQGCVVALEMWDDESARLLSQHSVQIARETGSLSELALALSARTPVLVLCGEIAGAASTVAETETVEEATGVSAAPYGALILAAWRGRENSVRDLVTSTMREATARNEGIGVAICEYARAVLCNGMGEYEEALEAATSASDFHEVIAENWGLSELVEPAVRTGRTDLAFAALHRLETKARATGTDWALGVTSRSRAMLSEGSAAEQAFREAIERLGRARVRAECARAQLLYGEWLRRAGRRVDARRELTAAFETFSPLGMEAFADRARRELIASGGRARKRTVETREDLTPQETQIARLARDGYSNPEIAAHLFISSRTVEWHLRKVFTKLGIKSRRQLPAALADAGLAVASA